MSGIKRIDVLTTSCGHRHHGRRLILADGLDHAVKDRLRSAIAVAVVEALGCSHDRWVIAGNGLGDYYFATAEDANWFASTLTGG